MDIGLLSGIGAFLDTSGMHYPLPFLTCHSYLWHILLITIGIICGFSGISDYTWRGFRLMAVLFAALCGAATILNLIIGRIHTIDLFYISPLLSNVTDHYFRFDGRPSESSADSLLSCGHSSGRGSAPPVLAVSLPYQNPEKIGNSSSFLLTL